MAGDILGKEVVEHDILYTPLAKKSAPESQIGPPLHAECGACSEKALPTGSPRPILGPLRGRLHAAHDQILIRPGSRVRLPSSGQAAAAGHSPEALRSCRSSGRIPGSPARNLVDSSVHGLSWGTDFCKQAHTTRGMARLHREKWVPGLRPTTRYTLALASLRSRGRGRNDIAGAREAGRSPDHAARRDRRAAAAARDQGSFARPPARGQPARAGRPRLVAAAVCERVRGGSRAPLEKTLWRDPTSRSGSARALVAGRHCCRPCWRVEREERGREGGRVGGCVSEGNRAWRCGSRDKRVVTRVLGGRDLWGTRACVCATRAGRRCTLLTLTVRAAPGADRTALMRVSWP